MAALSEQKGQLQPTHSSRSTGSTSTFIAACPPGALDPPGLSPVAKVYVRPASGKRPKKPSALDRHLRRVVLLQCSNRNKAHQHAAATQQKHKQHQRFLDWGHRLRSAILHRGHSNGSTSTNSCESPSSSPEPAHLSTAPAQPTENTCSITQHHADCAEHRHDIIQSWKPVAAAAQIRELQETLAKQQRRLRKTLPHVLDPNTLRPDYQIQQQQLLQDQEEEGYSTGLYSSISLAAHKAAALQSPGKSGNQMSGLGGRSTAAAGQGQLQQDDADGSLDVDSFLDGLLQQASAATTTPAQQKTAAGKAAPSTKPQQRPTCQSQQQQHAKTQDAQHSLQDSPEQRPASSCSKRGQRAVPAWAVSEAAAAQAEAAAAEEEEESLLEFAEGLDWQKLLQDLGDDELAAAFKDLELADAAAAEGQADVDKRWQQCFVTALNAAAMKGISDTNAAVAAGTNSQQGDKHSFLSSASAIRRAEAAAARRQQLLRKLHCMTGTQPSADAAAAAAAAAGGSLAAAGSAAGSIKAGSVCGSSMGSRLGPGGCMSLAAAAAAGAESWDSSTVVSNSAEDVGRLRCAIKHLEAGEVLADNPEMKGVHSTASVRSMLSKMEAA